MTFADSIAVDADGGVSRALLFVDPAADYLTDHFPGAPTLPGLVMLESAVRAAAALEGASGATLQHVERLQIVRRVAPGETLVVEVKSERGPGTGDRRPGDDGSGWFTARGTVGGETAMRARFRLRR